MVIHATSDKHLILYADDDYDDLMLLQLGFQRYADKVEVMTFTDGDAALSYLHHLPASQPAPCLIILDVNMPRMNGKEALREIRKSDRFRQTPVVLYTTSSFSGDRDFAAAFNAGLITKPLNNKQFDVIVDELIGYCFDEIKSKIWGQGRDRKPG